MPLTGGVWRILSGGFQVDLGALERASEGVNSVLLDLENEKISDIGGKSADYGQDGFAGVVSDFCTRWELGVENLAKDAREIASRLSLSAQTYVQVEGALAAHIAETFQRSRDVDPAAGKW